MNNYNKDRIAYSNWARLNHPDTERRQYWDDQCRQREVRNELRSKSAEFASRELAKAARETIALKYGEADEAQEHKWKRLSFVLKPDGSVAPPGWLAQSNQKAERERIEYWRPDSRGGWRHEPIVKLVKASGVRGLAGQKRETGTTRSEYDFEIITAKARGFFLAAEAGLASLARKLLEEIGRYTIQVVHEESGGMLVLACPMHAKPEALHPQPTWSPWSPPVPRPDGKAGRPACLKMGGIGYSSNRIFSYLGKSLIGARAQTLLGLNVDALTGRKNAAAGIERILQRKSKLKKPMDVRVRDRIEAYFEERIRLPEYVSLIPHWDESERIYRARKGEQLDLLSSWDSQKQLDDAKAEVIKERAAREAAEKNVAELSKRLEQAEKTIEVSRVPSTTAGNGPTTDAVSLAQAVITPKKATLHKTAPFQAAVEAAPAAAAVAKYTAEEVIAAVQVANDAVKEGKDLAGLTDRQREIVEIKPATRVKKVNTPKGMVAELDGAGKEIQEPNPFAGKVGLTPSAYQSVTGVVFTSKKALENKDIKASDRDMHTAKLSSYEEALASARTSMGLPEKGPEKVQEGPAPDMDPGEPSP